MDLIQDVKNILQQQQQRLEPFEPAVRPNNEKRQQSLPRARHNNFTSFHE